MDSQKVENLLNLAYSASPQERAKSPALSGGVNTDSRWDIIVKSSADLSYLEESHPQIEVISLYQNYSVLTLPKELIPFVASLEEVTFIELPKRIFFEINQGIGASCILRSYQPPLSLSGKGVLIGIVDSGIDTTHPDFRMPDGSSRIRYLWDQTQPGNPPPGYRIGTEYDSAQINEGLIRNRPVSSDPSGHGTAVAGIAAGNGRASEGRYRGVAFNSELIVVKLRPAQPSSFPRTSELMTGINYCIQKSIELGLPLALNLSFGNNYGAHTGSSLLETFLDQAAALGRVSVVAGSGNEGASPIHTSGRVTSAPFTVEFSVGPSQPSLDLQLWKNFADDFTVRIILPSGESIGPLPSAQGPLRYQPSGCTLLIYYGKPLPYQFWQELFFDMIPDSSYLPSGIWRIVLEPVAVKNGEFHMWLPSSSILNVSTRFLRPTPELTLTIPSTASKVITVGAYDDTSLQFADFSGRGLEGKPDLVAPGVNITAPASPAGYQSFTGTSFAAPFVTGSAALMMEWGIRNGNDPYLYGEKIKAALARSARQLPGYFVTPNTQTGYGALCLEPVFS